MEAAVDEPRAQGEVDVDLPVSVINTYPSLQVLLDLNTWGQIFSSDLLPSRTQLHLESERETGGWKRRSPTGGAAYGISYIVW